MARDMDTGLRKAGLVPARESDDVQAQYEWKFVQDILASPPNPDTFGARPCMDNKAFVFLLSDGIRGPTLIRHEYKLASRLIEEEYARWLSDRDKNKSNQQVLVITGQPGSGVYYLCNSYYTYLISSIGKTIFNRLLQVQRISQRKKTIYTWDGGLYFFDGNITWSTTKEFDSAPFAFHVKQFDREIWVLYDARDAKALRKLPSEGNTMLYRVFSGAFRPLFSIFTTSPTETRWQKLDTGIWPEVYYMMPWNRQELQTL